TGAVSFLGDLATRVFKSGFWVGIIFMMIVTAVLSAFINNTPVVALFLPILLVVARESGFIASRILMPVSFASMFGGVCTLIGTSTNILVSSIAEKNGLRPFSMFEFTPLGLIFVAIGIVYMFAVGIRLIPERRSEGDLVEEFKLEDYLAEVVILEGSASIGKALYEAPIVKDLDITILKIERGDEVIQLPTARQKLQEGDILLIRTDLEQLRSLHEREGVQFKPQTKWGETNVASGDFRLLEAVVDPSSKLVGSTLQRSNFRERYGATRSEERRVGKGGSSRACE